MSQHEPVCRICATPAQPWERNQDGSYTHVQCATAEANRLGFRPLTPKEAPRRERPHDRD